MSDTIFTGPIAPKNKKELQEIAESFGLSSEGRRDQLVERIKQHISDNEDTLRDDPRYSGLLKRSRGRKGSQPPSTHSPSEPEPEPVEIKVTRSRMSPIAESTPAFVHERDARDVSFSLKNPLPLSAHNTPTKPTTYTSITAPSTHTVSRTSVREEAEVSNEEEEDSAPSVTPVPTISTSTKLTASISGPTAAKMALQPNSPMEEVRTLLSNSRNIWSLSSVCELLYIFIVITPWQYYTLPNTSLSLPYPPLFAFQTPVFWLTLLHWILPTIIIPASVGNLITFVPNLKTAAAPFDPLTAAIVRLAANKLYSHPSYPVGENLKVTTDVLGEQWRVTSASVGVAFAFAEVAGLVVKAVTKES